MPGPSPAYPFLLPKSNPEADSGKVISKHPSIHYHITNPFAFRETFRQGASSLFFLWLCLQMSVKVWLHLTDRKAVFHLSYICVLEIIEPAKKWLEHSSWMNECFPVLIPERILPFWHRTTWLVQNEEKKMSVKNAILGLRKAYDRSIKFCQIQLYDAALPSYGHWHPGENTPRGFRCWWLSTGGWQMNLAKKTVGTPGRKCSLPPYGLGSIL